MLQLLRHSHRQTIAVYACALIVCLQGMLPRGFMPGSVADGQPIVLCSQVFPAGFLEQRVDRDALRAALKNAALAQSENPGAPGKDDSDSGQRFQADDHCTLCHSLNQSATPTAYTLELLPLVGTTRFGEVARVFVPYARHVRYQSRAPPFVLA